ncbi:hypothetical protein BH09MYX1_BH09MYX1_44560 [soil metagenome]
MSVRLFAALGLALACAAAGCSSCKGDARDADAGASDDGTAGEASAPLALRTAEDERLWVEAKDGDEDELRRLAAREGASGLGERSTDPALRMTALRAMAFAEGFAQLPALGAAAATAPEAEATIAADSAVTLAARPRAQVDPEDAEELHDGCGALLGAAKDMTRPKLVRTSAVRALRMLADQGYVNAADIPTDLDAK